MVTNGTISSNPAAAAAAAAAAAKQGRSIQAHTHAGRTKHKYIHTTEVQLVTKEVEVE